MTPFFLRFLKLLVGLHAPLLINTTNILPVEPSAAFEIRKVEFMRGASTQENRQWLIAVGSIGRFVCVVRHVGIDCSTALYEGEDEVLQTRDIILS